MAQPEASLPDVTAASVAAVIAELGDEAQVERKETHMSVVLLCGERVFKVRRALEFGFADHTSLEARRASAEAEVRLNAELAPGIYRVVHAVVQLGGAPRLTDVAAGGAIDYVVEMRRFSDAETLAALLATDPTNAALGPRIYALAKRLVVFHNGAPVDQATPVDPGPAASRQLAAVGTEIAELVGILTDNERRRSVASIGHRLEAAALACAGELAERGRAGLVREVHGDLRAVHVLLPESGDPVVVDRLEYRRDLRTIDVADDLSFLIMDLIDAGRRTLAAQLVEGYVRAGGSVCSSPLLALFAARRALVRAKVELVRAAQGGADAAAAQARSDRLLGTARLLAWRTLGPRVIVLCGGSGSGKSHLAGAVAEVSGMQVFSSDVVRKQLLGVELTDRAAQSAYAPEMTRQVYEELGRRAAAVAAAGEPVIIDATCLRRAERDVLRESLGRHSNSAVFVQCVAPAAVIDARVAARAEDPARVSDATTDVVARQRALAEPLDEIPAARHHLLRTDRDVGECVATLEVLLRP
jgi:aminoglycoside phosphotransferase family enzyme/predicted kinase